MHKKKKQKHTSNHAAQKQANTSLTNQPKPIQVQHTQQKEKNKINLTTVYQILEIDVVGYLFKLKIKTMKRINQISQELSSFNKEHLLKEHQAKISNPPTNTS